MDKQKLGERLDKLISELDTVTGMLIVASMTDKNVAEAKDKVINVSFELGEIINDEELF